MTTAMQLKALFKQLNSKNIVYNKAYYKLTDSVPGAVLLSHLAYLFSDVFGGKEFYQTDSQLMDSLGFSDRTLRTAKDSIKKYVTSVKKGYPPKNYWCVNEELLIEDLLALPASVRRPVGVENVPINEDENVPTVGVENVPTKNEENKNEDLKNNSNSVVGEKILKQAAELGITAEQIHSLVDDFGGERVKRHFISLMMAKGVKSPIAWLTRAIKDNYPAREAFTAIISSVAAQPWDEMRYRRDCREREKLSDPNDWREEMLQSRLQK